METITNTSPTTNNDTTHSLSNGMCQSDPISLSNDNNNPPGMENEVIKSPTKNNSPKKTLLSQIETRFMKKTQNVPANKNNTSTSQKTSRNVNRN